MIFLSLILISKEYLYIYLTKFKKMSAIDAKDVSFTTYPEVIAMITFILVPIGIPLIAIYTLYPLSLCIVQNIKSRYNIKIFNEAIVFVILTKLFFNNYFYNKLQNSFFDVIVYHITRNIDRGFHTSSLIIIDQYNFDLDYHKIVFIAMLIVLFILSFYKIININIPFYSVIMFIVIVATHLGVHIFILDKPEDISLYFTQRFSVILLSMITSKTLLGITFLATDTETTPIKNSGVVVYTAIISVMTSFLLLSLHEKYAIVYAVFIANISTIFINKYFKEDTIANYTKAIMIASILIFSYSVLIIFTPFH